MKRTRNILTRNWILISMGVVVLSLRGIVWAESFPHYTVDAMCDKADAIIEGTYLRKNEVQFDNIYKGSPLLDKNSKTVEVAQLQKHDRDLWGGFRDKGKATPQIPVVFL